MNACATCADALLTSLDIFGPMHADNVGTWAKLHGFTDDQITSTVCWMESQGLIAIRGGVVVLVPAVQEEIPAKYLAAADAYRRARYPTVRDRITAALVTLWHKCWGGILLIVATTFLTIGLCAVEVPDSLIRGLVMVESGGEWISTGEIRGKWKRGADGEISHFQLTASALREMKVEHLSDRIAREPVLAESMARRFLLICYQKRGNWPDALATYNAWSRYRSSDAKDYARRVLNLADVL